MRTKNATTFGVQMRSKNDPSKFRQNALQICVARSLIDLKSVDKRKVTFQMNRKTECIINEVIKTIEKWMACNIFASVCKRSGKMPFLNVVNFCVRFMPCTHNNPYVSVWISSRSSLMALIEDCVVCIAFVGRTIIEFAITFGAFSPSVCIEVDGRMMSECEKVVDYTRKKKGKELFKRCTYNEKSIYSSSGDAFFET